MFNIGPFIFLKVRITPFKKIRLHKAKIVQPKGKEKELTKLQEKYN